MEPLKNLWVNSYLTLHDTSSTFAKKDERAATDADWKAWNVVDSLVDIHPQEQYDNVFIDVPNHDGMDEVCNHTVQGKLTIDMTTFRIPWQNPSTFPEKRKGRETMSMIAE